MWLIDWFTNMNRGHFSLPPPILSMNTELTQWARQYVTQLTAPVEGHMWVYVSILLYKWYRSHPQLAMYLYALKPTQAWHRGDILDNNVSAYVSSQVHLFKQC